MPRFTRWDTIRPPFAATGPPERVLVDYQFRPLGKTCAATGGPLAPGSDVQSVIVERQGACERLDFASSAWNGMPDGAIARWRCRVPDAPRQQETPLDPEALLNYFEQLVEDANPGHDKLRYVLALYLLQKRRLRLDGSRRDDHLEFLQLSGSRGEGPFEIADQQLAEAEIRQLQAEIGQMVNSEWKAS